MMRTGARSLLRSATRPAQPIPSRTVLGRRFLTTEPPHLRSRSWKSSAFRWGIAIAGIYYYNTSPVFADHPENNLLNPNVDALEDQNSTLDALTASSRRKSQKDASILQSAIETTSEIDASPDSTAEQGQSQPTSNASIAIEAPDALEEEAAGEGAFNPETGEINWDCPCLGGMAHGPCGPQFREAFSCFVYSTEEPKGMDCIDKFQNMQNCFREHPDVYKGEIEDEEELDAELAQEREQLAQEIAERKKSVSENASKKSGDHRLLEEPASSEKPKKTKKSKKEKESKNTSATSASSPASQPEKKFASSSEPHPGMSAEHEALNEDASSQINRKIMPASFGEASHAEDELVPRASFDAASARQTEK